MRHEQGVAVLADKELETSCRRPNVSPAVHTLDTPIWARQALGELAEALPIRLTSTESSTSCELLLLLLLWLCPQIEVVA
jgi:hypothetical protein